MMLEMHGIVAGYSPQSAPGAVTRQGALGLDLVPRWRIYTRKPSTVSM